MEETAQDVFVTPPQLDGDLVTLTLLPRARWQTLLNLEVIQVRAGQYLVRPLPCIDCPRATATQQTERACQGAREGTVLPADAAWRGATLRRLQGAVPGPGTKRDGEADEEARKSRRRVGERVLAEAQG